MDRSQPILSCVTGNSIQIVFHRLASTDPMDSVNSGKIISKIYRGNFIGAGKYYSKTRGKLMLL